MYALLVAVTIPIGLATRKLPELFPQIVDEYGGDVLWAVLFFFISRFIWIRKSLLSIAIITFAFAVAIECSQLYQAPWINNLRATFPGQMILGHTFLWTDILCYAVGVGLAGLIAALIERKRNHTALK